MIRTLAAALWLVGAGMTQGAMASDEGSGVIPVTTEHVRAEVSAKALRLEIRLPHPVPWRSFTLADPPRAVIDLAGAGWSDSLEQTLDLGPHVVRAGAFLPGWSRLVIALEDPLALVAAHMRVDNEGKAVLDLSLEKTTPEAFADRSGAPDAAGWDGAGALGQQMPALSSEPREFLVVLDPGHGGVDPGAQREGLVEKDLMLDVALALAEQLRARGVTVELTRDTDRFVALQTRVAFAQRSGADLFVSLHADSNSNSRARGSTIYTLALSAHDAASQALSQRHARQDVLAGLDLSGQGDEVSGVLLDLARLRTAPLSEGFANLLYRSIAARGLPLGQRPLRKAGFSVLASADVPSVLLELGFLSSAQDRANLSDPAWRAQMIGAIADAITDWKAVRTAETATLRQ